MANAIVLGPILGLESDSSYTVTIVTNNTTSKVEVEYAGQIKNASIVGHLYSGIVWRAELDIVFQDSQIINYSLLVDDEITSNKNGNSSWSFYVPHKTEKPKIAYASCNGFSDYKLMTSTENPYALWHEMKIEHEKAPFSLMLMGGDQVYADSIWSKLSSLKTWNELNRADKIKRKATKEMKSQIDRFYSELYVDRWNREPMATMLASIPSIMMWDDHDIFDGWGSYPQEMQECDVYRAIFEEAKRHFILLQIRSLENKSLLSNNNVDPAHLSCVHKFRGYHILSLDNRSERTLENVMSKEHWEDITQYLNQNIKGDLLVLSAVPVVYRDFSFSESVVDITPWEEELTDDLKDHWRAKEHEGERLKLIMNLLKNASGREGKTVILSGDVHVGCLGIIRDERNVNPVNIHQIVSSGIVHPAPTYIQWLGVLAVTNDKLEYLDETHLVTANMLKPQGSNKYIRARNFITLLEGNDNKLWVNWICEGKDRPAFPLQ